MPCPLLCDPEPLPTAETAYLHRACLVMMSLPSARFRVATCSCIPIVCLSSGLRRLSCTYVRIASSLHVARLWVAAQCLNLPPLFSFRKRQTSQGYQPHMAHQVVISLHTSSRIKAGRVNSVGVGERVLKAGTRVRDSPCSHCWVCPTRTPSCTIVTYMQRT